MTVGNIPPKGLNEDAWQPDAESLNALEAEIPTLAILRSFADEVCHQPWFTELGEPLGGSVKIWHAPISMGWATPMPRPRR